MLQVYKPKLPSGFWHVPLLFSLFRKLSSLSNFRSDSNCMSGLASISRQVETINEREPLRTQSPWHIGWLGDLPSRGLEMGVVPLVLLQIGDATGVMAVGDAKPAEQTRSCLVSQGHSWKFSRPCWISLISNVDFTIYRIYTQTCMCTYKYIWQVPWLCRTTAHVGRIW